MQRPRIEAGSFAYEIGDVVEHVTPAGTVHTVRVTDTFEDEDGRGFVGDLLDESWRPIYWRPWGQRLPTPRLAWGLDAQIVGVPDGRTLDAD
jgi:hypothetical protein